jgi:SAM-dependent methyltransferase
VTDRLAAQYEAFPYPARDAAEEKTRLIVGSPSGLDELAHLVFAGRLPPSRPFRALFAGGGTGDGLIMLAQEAHDRGIDARLAYLDLSTASRRIAEARAAARGLDSIAFHTGSLTDPAACPGPFDYIDCCGVLHHLDDPAAGLAALARRLAPGGGMGLMLYAPYGRTGVYELQEALALLAPESLAAGERIVRARRLLAGLPKTNRFRRNPQLGDHRMGDAGLFDLLLHSRDVAFTVADIATLLAGAGLALAGFATPARYAPETYLSDPRLRAAAAALAPWQRAGLAEALAGNIKTHVLYAVEAGRETTAVARPGDPAQRPVLREIDGKALARSAAAGGRPTAELDGLVFPLPLPPLGPAMLERIDGHRDLAAIHAEIAATRKSGLAWEEFLRQFQHLHATLNGLGRMFLRAGGEG